MQVEELTSSLQETPAILLDNIRDQFNQKVKVPLSNLDEDFVTGLTGIYQQALKENGLRDGIEAEGTVKVLGYEQDVSISWSPDILLSPDLVHWAQGQSEEVRQRVNYLVSLAYVLYAEFVNQLEELVNDSVNTVRTNYVQPVLDQLEDRLGSAEQRLDEFRSDPVGEVLSVIRE